VESRRDRHGAVGLVRSAGCPRVAVAIDGQGDVRSPGGDEGDLPEPRWRRQLGSAPVLQDAQPDHPPLTPTITLPPPPPTHHHPPPPPPRPTPPPPPPPLHARRNVAVHGHVAVLSVARDRATGQDVFCAACGAGGPCQAERLRAEAILREGERFDRRRLDGGHELAGGEPPCGFVGEQSAGDAFGLPVRNRPVGPGKTRSATALDKRLKNT